MDRGYVGVDYDMVDDLTGRFPDAWAAFNKQYIPRFLEVNPGKTRVAAGLACGTLWTLGQGIQEGDYVRSCRRDKVAQRQEVHQHAQGSHPRDASGRPA